MFVAALFAMAWPNSRAEQPLWEVGLGVGVLRLPDYRGSDQSRVWVVPVTHTPPASADHAIEIPLAIKRHLGLDDARSWIVMTETNTFLWPGPDLRRLSGRADDSIAYGMLPPQFYEQLRQRLLALLRQRRVRDVPGTE